MSLSSLAGSISSRLGGLNPARRVSSGGHTTEEVADLMTEGEGQGSGSSSEGETTVAAVCVLFIEQ